MKHLTLELKLDDGSIFASDTYRTSDTHELMLCGKVVNVCLRRKTLPKLIAATVSLVPIAGAKKISITVPRDPNGYGENTYADTAWNFVPPQELGVGDVGIYQETWKHLKALFVENKLDPYTPQIVYVQIVSLDKK